MSPEPAAMTKDEAQRSIRTFYEGVILDLSYNTTGQAFQGVRQFGPCRIRGCLLAFNLPWEAVEKAADPGCSKMSGCKAPEILSREAYLFVR